MTYTYGEIASTPNWLPEFIGAGKEGDPASVRYQLISAFVKRGG